MNLLFKNNKKLDEYNLTIIRKYIDDIKLFIEYPRIIKNYFIYKFVYCLNYSLEKLDNLKVFCISNVDIVCNKSTVYICIYTEINLNKDYIPIYPIDKKQLIKITRQILNNINDIYEIEYIE